MNTVLLEMAEAVKLRQNHSFVVSGNVYDLVPWGQQTYRDVTEFLTRLTEKKFPQCLFYDLFSGVRIVRGEEKKIIKEMGLAQSSSADPNADLINALKKAKAINSSPLPVNPLEAFPCFEGLLQKSQTPTVLIIDYADALVPTQLQNIGRQAERVLGIALTKWSRDSQIRENGHLIFLVCRHASDLSEEILDRTFQFGQFRIPKPDEIERLEFFESRGIVPGQLGIIAKATAGLAYKELTAIAAEIDRGGLPDPEATLRMIFSRKKKVLNDEYGDVLEVIKTSHGFEAIGGLEKPIAKLKSVAAAISKGRTSLVPQGILFMGPPGTGKTILAETFAKEAGLNFVKPLDIKSMWVGQSEQRMSRFINAVRDLAPVVVFVDEFDQNQGQRGGFEGDSGVSRSLFKKMLEVMSDTALRGKVLWILASNRPDLIDPAMKRPGRCDLRIPFLPPDSKQLILICEAAFRQYPDMKHEIKNWQPYMEDCRGYSGADMVEVVRRAWEHANEIGREATSDDDMGWACSDYQPQIVDRSMLARMTLLALMECSSRDLRPDNWREVGQDLFPEDWEEIEKALDHSQRGKIKSNAPSLGPIILKFLNPN